MIKKKKLATKKAKTGPRQIVARSHAELADVLGQSIRTIENWGRAGLPGTKGRWPLKDILSWLRTEGPWKPKVFPAVDSLMQGNDSPALERYREARADLAEMEVGEKRGKLLDRDKLHMVFSRMAEINRRTGRRLEAAFGQRALDIYCDGLENSKRLANRVLLKAEKETAKQSDRRE